MDADELLGFTIRTDGETNLSKLVARAMQVAHVAHITKSEPQSMGYFFQHPNAETALQGGLSDLQYDATKANEDTLRKVNNARAFPVSDLACGIFLRKRVFLRTWPRADSTVCSPIMCLHEKKKEVSIKFAHIVNSSPMLRRLSFKFKDIDKSLIHLTRSRDRVILYVPLVRSPSTYDSSANEKLSFWVCCGTKDPWSLATGCLYNDQDLTWQFLASLTVIRLEFDLRYRANEDLESYLRSFGVVSDVHFSIRDDRVSNILPTLTLQDIETSELSFRLKYKLCCLLSHGYTSCFHMPAGFISRIRRLPEIRVDYALKRVYESGKTFNARPDDFEEKFELYYAESESQTSVLHEEDSKDKSCDSHLLCRVLVTPSTLYFTLPSRELSNRVTRHYSQHIDRFLRMSFVDERLSNLSSFSVSIHMHITENFLPIFRLFGIEYELLSFSSSQLRAGSLWLFGNLPDLTVRDIRAWLGDFSAIKNPAKYSARVGQCFSNSKSTIELQDSELVEIKEVVAESGGKKYTMSDGAGTISRELAEAAAAKMPSWKFELGQSIQVRIGGFKGVVSVDPTLTGSKLCWRPSMKKFSSTHRGLEILNFAQFRYGYLNRQIILLLSSLGIEDSAFLAQQNDYLDSMKKIFTDSKALRHAFVVSDSDGVESPAIVKVIDQMLCSSLSAASDPFLRSAAQALYNRMIMELRQKQRIIVKKSACLIGVLDETGTLEYGQTYIRISNPGPDEFKMTVTGFVAVTKNPCFHPGDVRRLEALDLPQLQHHVNVIVFPKKGPRPHPNEISGSDLDGDLYFVTWHEDLVPDRMVEAMDYSASGTPTEVDEMTSECMRDFFLQFISNDNLGIIANAHLALADQSPQKAWDERCLRLANMHSTAVDFAKTGVSNKIPPELKPSKYPDFMENKNKEMYESEKVIGVLYRQAKDFVFQPSSEDSPVLSEPHPDLRAPAQELYDRYKAEIRAIMNLFNIETEAELLTGEVAKYSKFYNNNKKKRREEIRTKLKDVVGKLMAGLTLRFIEKAEDRRTQLALECQYLAYSDPSPQKHYGFPWVVAHNELLRT